MTFDEFTTYRDQALMLHASQEGPHQVGLDAIFTAVVAHAASAQRRMPGRPPAERSTAPEWFTEALGRLKGQKVTVSSFLLLSGHSPVSDDDARNVGRWLRDAGHTPRKQGGQQLFQL